MTSSGSCHRCGKLAERFHYRRPLKDAGYHDGFWHCVEHGPNTKTTSSGETVVVLDETVMGTRAERRAELRKNKKKIKF